MKLKNTIEPLSIALKKMTPKELKKWRENLQSDVKDHLRDESDKKALSGKYDPQNIVLGACRVCPGDIVQKVTRTLMHPDRIGGHNESVAQHSHFYCKSCGIMYEFVPPTKTQPQNFDVGDHGTVKTYNSMRNFLVENDEEE